MILEKRLLARFVKIVQEIKVILLAAENTCMCNIIFSIKLYLNREVKPVRHIRRQDTKIGDCHLAFSPIPFVRGGGKG